MSRRAPPPLRFLVLVLGGWIVIRAVVWIGWRQPAADEAATATAALTVPAPADSPRVLITRPGQVMSQLPGRGPPRVGIGRAGPSLAMVENPAPFSTIAVAPVHSAPVATPDARARPFVPAASAAFPLPPSTSRSRWSASAWLLARPDGAPAALAPAGLLGGSQAGGRLLYRLNGDPARPFAIAARVSGPLRGPGAEAALGVDWRPFARLPVHFLAERRQGLDGDGRSAFAALLHGGASAALPANGRLDVYAQAGAVGLTRRDLFVDGAARIGLPLGPVEIGGGVWAAAQPGAARLDAGPHVSLPLRSRDANLRLSADWRFRLAGEAAPGSGPALTLATDF